MRARGIPGSPAVATPRTFTVGVFTVGVFTVGVGCTGDLPSPSAVTSLRLFALTTPTPDVRPGDGARITAVWYDPTPGRTVWFRWRLCPEAPNGDARACASPLAGTDRGTDLGVNTDGLMDLPPALLTLAPGTTVTDHVVYVAICPGAVAMYDPALGHYGCPSPEGIEAVRRVTVRATAPRNHDPGVTEAWLGDGSARVTISPSVGPPSDVTACGAPPCAAWSFGVQPASDAAETLGDGSAEVLQASFYATVGTLDPPRAVGTMGSDMALTTRWTPPVGMAGTVVRLWVVLRDQRGGDTVATGAVTLR